MIFSAGIPLATSSRNLATRQLVFPDPGDPITVAIEPAGRALALNWDGDNSRLLTETRSCLRINLGSVIFQRY